MTNTFPEQLPFLRSETRCSPRWNIEPLGKKRAGKQSPLTPPLAHGFPNAIQGQLACNSHVSFHSGRMCVQRSSSKKGLPSSPLCGTATGAVLTVKARCVMRVARMGWILMFFVCKVKMWSKETLQAVHSSTRRCSATACWNDASAAHLFQGLEQMGASRCAAVVFTGWVNSILRSRAQCMGEHPFYSCSRG